MNMEVKFQHENSPIIIDILCHSSDDHKSTKKHKLNQIIRKPNIVKKFILKGVTFKLRMKPPKIKKEKPSDEKKALSTGFQKNSRKTSNTNKIYLLFSLNIKLINTIPKLNPRVFFVLCVNVDINKHNEQITKEENIGVILINMYCSLL